MSRDRSVAFDRAADYYDQTRSQPPAIMEQIIDMASAEFEGKGRCLEIGVGTGRIALPLFEQGIEMVGIDLSAPMLAKLVDKTGGAPSFPLARADATRLPFRDGSFGAGIAIWVLHLIPEWRAALAELVRVIEPGGVVLVDGGQPQGGVFYEIQQRFLREAGAPRKPRGTWDRQEVEDQMQSLGSRVRDLPAIEDTRAFKPGDVIDQFEQGIFSVTWSISPDERSRAASETRRWATAKWGALDAEIENEWTIRWRAYDL